MSLAQPYRPLLNYSYYEVCLRFRHAIVEPFKINRYEFVGSAPHLKVCLSEISKRFVDTIER